MTSIAFSGLSLAVNYLVNLIRATDPDNHKQDRADGAPVPEKNEKFHTLKRIAENGTENLPLQWTLLLGSAMVTAWAAQPGMKKTIDDSPIIVTSFIWIHFGMRALFNVFYE